LIKNRELLAIKASAGSGKTFALTLRYIELLLNNVSPSNILAVTFTKKASFEMQKKILFALKDLSTKKQASPYFDELIKRDPRYRDKLEKEIHTITRRFISSKKNITTIDSFFNSILLKFCWYGNLRHGYSFNETEYKVINKTFLDSLTSEEIQKLSSIVSLQRISIERFLEYMGDLVFLEPEYTISKKSANPLEAKDRAFELGKDIASEILQTNLSDHHKKSAIFESFEDLLEKTWVKNRYFSDFGWYKKIANEQYEATFQELKKWISIYFSELQQEGLNLFFDFLDKYKKCRLAFIKERNSISFEDLALEVFNLLQNMDLEDKAEFLYFRLDAKLEHILIDEFQDTSILQYLILKPLIDEIHSGIGQNEFRTLFYVGDTKQSIYRFRGARSGLFDELLRSEEMNLKEEKLNTNYRSKKVIVDFVNSTFRGKIEGYFDQHTPEDIEYSGGYVEVKSSEEPAMLAAKKVIELRGLGVRDEDIAILTFTNDATSLIADYLSELDSNIKISTESTQKTVYQQENLAIISLLRYLVFKENIYLAIFNGCIGKSPIELEKIEFDIDLPLYKLIEHIAKTYDLMGANILKLIELSFGYKDIFDFICNIENNPSTISSRSAKGVRIMTIHKSKGLDFRHLIVLDRLSQENKRRDFFIKKYDGLYINGLEINFSKRKDVDEEFKKVIEIEEAEERRDLLNQLYVAFTRGKDSLYIFKKNEKSAFDVLDIIECSFGELDIKQEWGAEISKKTEILFLENLGRQEGFVRRGGEVKRPNLHSLYFGKALHLVLEYCDFGSGEFDIGIMQAKNRYGFYLQNSDFLEIERRIKNLLSNDEFKKIIEGELYREVPISFGGVRGYLDLLVLNKNGASVIDYKSSLGFREKIAEQLEFYKKGLESFGFEKPRGYIIYLDGDETKISGVF